MVLDRLGVSEVIDFRAQEEVDQDPPDVWTSTVEVLYTRNESGDLASTSGAIATDGKVLRHRQDCSAAHGGCMRHDGS